MTQDEITRIADKAFATPFVEPAFRNGFFVVTIDELKRFAELVAAAEREACAKLCDELQDEDGYDAWSTECAAAIRARGNT